MVFLHLRLRTIIPIVVIGIFLPIGIAIIGLTYFESLSDLELNSKNELTRQLADLSLRLDRVGEDEKSSLSEAQHLLSSAGAADGIVHLSLLGTDEKVIASTRFEWIGKTIGSVWGKFDLKTFQNLFHGSNHEIIHYRTNATLHAYHFTKLRAPSGKYLRSITQAALVGEYNYNKAQLTLEKRLRQKATFYFVALMISAALITFLLIRLVSRPVERFSEFVTSFDDKSFGDQVKVSGSSEMRTLGLAVNSMSEMLNSYNEQIKSEIKERKNTEEILRRFRTALDSSADSVYVIDPETMLFIDLNRTACESLGYSKDELLSMGPQDIKPLMSKSLLTEKIALSIKNAEIQKIETVHQRKDGTQFPVEIFLRTLKDNNEKQIVIASVRDITERKANEAMLRKLYQAIEQTGEAVLITDANAVIEYVNPAFTGITGYTSEEAVGKTPAITHSTAQGPQFYKDLWSTISRGSVWQGTLTDKRKDGSFYPAMMSVAPICDETGEITHYVSIQQDMTEYKRLENQFLQAQKMESIGTLVGGIAHDFNNMLAGIMGNAYLARGRANDNQPLIENIDTINMLSIRAADMIKQLLAFARKGVVNVEPLSINDSVKEGGKLAQAGIPESIEFTLDVCQEELVVKGDVTQLQQVIMNLSNNARDAVIDSPHPKIICSLEKFLVTDKFLKAHPDMNDRAFALITIRDNGSGISDEHLEKIFEPFFTTKEVGKGTGLGLAMVYGCVQSHRGILEVESAVGHGTTFYVYLPLIKTSEAPEQEKTDIAQGHGETVLLVDDEECMRNTTSEVLRSMNYTVLEAVDGEEALAMFKTHQNDIDLILTDIVMPKMGGIDLAKSIRKIDMNIAIIFATGYDKEQAISKENRIDQSAIISKPFSFEELSQLMQSMVNTN